jgi:transcriptional regulator with XRE-family HTH domain
MTNPFEDQTPDNVKDLRTDAGLTRAQAAALIGASQWSWKDWELGRRPAPAGTLKRFAQAVWDRDLAQATALDEIEQDKQLVKRMREQAAIVAPRGKIPDLPRFSHEVNKPTPEEEREMEADLANGLTLTSEQAAQAAREFRDEQDERLAQSNTRHADAVQRADAILKED